MMAHAEDFPGNAMHGAAPCTCPKKCRSRSGSVAFLGLFLLSLGLHAVTLAFYMDLRSEVRREIIHQKRDSVLTLAGSDPADPSVFSPGPQQVEPGSGGDRHEVKKKKKKACKRISYKFNVINFFCTLYSVLMTTRSDHVGFNLLSTFCHRFVTNHKVELCHLGRVFFHKHAFKNR